MPTFRSDWFSGNIPVWQTYLGHLADRPINCLEIGSYEGRSTLWICENLLTDERARITCVDTFEGSEEHTPDQKKNLFETFMENTKTHGSKITVYRNQSSIILRTLPYEQVYDLIYIDGDHHARNVLEDAVLCFRLLKVGGIMVFDDYGVPETTDLPRVGVDAFLSAYGPSVAVLHTGYQLILKKLAS